MILGVEEEDHVRLAPEIAQAHWRPVGGGERELRSEIANLRGFGLRSPVMNALASTVFLGSIGRDTFLAR